MAEGDRVELASRSIHAGIGARLVAVEVGAAGIGRIENGNASMPDVIRHLAVAVVPTGLIFPYAERQPATAAEGVGKHGCATVRRSRGVASIRDDRPVARGAEIRELERCGHREDTAHRAHVGDRLIDILAAGLIRVTAARAVVLQRLGEHMRPGDRGSRYGLAGAVCEVCRGDVHPLVVRPYGIASEGVGDCQGG